MTSDSARTASVASLTTARAGVDETSLKEDVVNDKDFIVFKTFRGDISFPWSQIAHHSKLFEGKLRNVKEGTNIFDLRQYDLSAVFLLIDFMNNKQLVRKALSHHAIVDLLQLADIFEMTTLNSQLKKLLNTTVDSSADDIVNALLSVGVHPKIWHSPLGRTLFEVALRNYQDLPKASSFHKIPYHIIIEILDSCDLMASNENDVFELARKWLKYNHNRVLYAANLLECVRFYRLNDQQRAYIFQSIRKLPQGNQLEIIAKTVVGSHNSFRACVLKLHWQNPRCGSSLKEIRDRPLNIVPNFIDLSHLRKTPLMPTGIKSQLRIDDKENIRVVIRNIHKPRSMRSERRKARELRNKEDLESIDKILGPIATTKNAEEQQKIEKLLGAQKLKSLVELKEESTSPAKSKNSEKESTPETVKSKSGDKSVSEKISTSPTTNTAREN